MKSLISALFISAVFYSGIYGDPFLFLPEKMLPPVGVIQNFTFDGAVGTWKVSGSLIIESVTDSDNKTIVGYRTWQTYVGEYVGTFYGVSYKNGTYPQALINSRTQECENIFYENLKCTGWTNSMNIRWENECSVVRVDPPITGIMGLTLYTSNSDLLRPVNYIGETYISGAPVNITTTFHFLTETEQKNFPSIKCPF